MILAFGKNLRQPPGLYNYNVGYCSTNSHQTSIRFDSMRWNEKETKNLEYDWERLLPLHNRSDAKAWQSIQRPCAIRTHSSRGHRTCSLTEPRKTSAFRKQRLIMTRYLTIARAVSRNSSSLVSPAPLHLAFEKKKMERFKHFHTFYINMKRGCHSNPLVNCEKSMKWNCQMWALSQTNEFSQKRIDVYKKGPKFFVCYCNGKGQMLLLEYI